MSWKDLDYQPDAEQMLLPVVPDGTVRVFEVVLPAPGVFNEGLQYWRQQLHEANEVGRPVLGHLAELTLKSLEISYTDWCTIAKERKANYAPNPFLAAIWYQKTAATIAQSQLAKDFLGTQPSDILDSASKNLVAAIGIDYDQTEPQRSGLHLHREMVPSLGVAVPEWGESTWYETEALYVHCQAPASPTAGFMER